MNEQIRTMHLFAGAGGGILADLILGHQPVVAVEWDKYACNVLRERAADGWFDGLDVWEGDVREFAAHDWQGRVDCIHAGFPCQDISVAGSQAGVGEDTRSGLYREVLRIADEVRPEYIFLENVAAIVTGDDGAMLRTVAGDIASRGYDAVWLCLSAAQVGANHKRDRWWLLAYPNGSHREGVRLTERVSARQLLDGRCESEPVSDTDSTSSQREKLTIGSQQKSTNYGEYVWWETEPDVGRVAHGIPSASHRLKALGNAQVPLQCATAFSLLWEIAFDGQDRTN
jgi:DNA (cytosine-5)-methyltransferase 1